MKGPSLPAPLSQSLLSVLSTALNMSLLSSQHFSSYFPKVSCLLCHSICEIDGEKLLQKSQPDTLLVFLRTGPGWTGWDQEWAYFRQGQHRETRSRKGSGQPLGTFSVLPLPATDLSQIQTLVSSGMRIRGFGKYVFSKRSPDVHD